MSRKNVFKTAEEAVEYLFSEELESEMIVLLPEVDEFTDEEGFDDSETLDPSEQVITCQKENTGFILSNDIVCFLPRMFSVKPLLIRGKSYNTRPIAVLRDIRVAFPGDKTWLAAVKYLSINSLFTE
ncbi:hypothetical protein NPIL_317351 [Nephila pilipes]|uniref:Uncharacterized protein n=1 Tax=Nephila pilipes TaxID=299642 RepID=A0A8X6PD16_NEPPI|nr:hypothetical protein NPIL_664081 [Nephila pilipes]GFT61524.1 hypothetical protein NPIL_317351 [Nephila pilipes]